jgi:hypothetical protein
MNMLRAFRESLAAGFNITTASAARTAAAAQAAAVNSAEAAQAAAGHAVEVTKASAADAATWVEASANYSAAMAPDTIRTMAPKVGTALLRGIGYNILLLEAVDILQNVIDKARRGNDIQRLHSELIMNGTINGGAKAAAHEQRVKHNELVSELERLQRTPQRRSFGQWLVDLPHRMWRRLKRAVIWEAGWWTAILTSPAWVLAGAVGLAWNLGVLGVAVFRDLAFKKDTDIFAATSGVNAMTNWVFRHTLAVGWNMMLHAASMRLHNAKAYSSEDQFPEIKAAHDVVFEGIVAEKAADFEETNGTPIDKDARLKLGVKGKDEAYRLGALMATQINSELADVIRKQHAIAQAPYWVEKFVDPNIAGAVQRGMRDATPFVYRDLAQVF